METETPSEVPMPKHLMPLALPAPVAWLKKLRGAAPVWDGQKQPGHRDTIYSWVILGKPNRIALAQRVTCVLGPPHPFGLLESATPRPRARRMRAKAGAKGTSPLEQLLRRL